MSRSCVRRPPNGPKSQLLAAPLPAADFRRLRPYLTTIPIRVKQVLHTYGEPIRDVYFPNGGVVSITTALSNGTPVEVPTVGDEGVLGMEAFLSDEAVASGDTSMQVPATNAEMLSVEDFRREARPRWCIAATGGTVRPSVHRADDANHPMTRCITYHTGVLTGC